MLCNALLFLRFLIRKMTIKIYKMNLHLPKSLINKLVTELEYYKYVI